jgi:hypothetical protein
LEGGLVGVDLVGWLGGMEGSMQTKAGSMRMVLTCELNMPRPKRQPAAALSALSRPLSPAAHLDRHLARRQHLEPHVVERLGVLAAVGGMCVLCVGRAGMGCVCGGGMG